MKKPTKKTGPRVGVKPNMMESSWKKRFLNFLNVHGQLDRARRETKGLSHDRLIAARRSDMEFESSIEQTIAQVKQRKIEKLEETAYERATTGRQRPIYHYDKKAGKAVIAGYENIPSDNLLMFQLKQLDPSYRDNNSTKINIDQRTQNTKVELTAKLTDEQMDALHEVIGQIAGEPKAIAAPIPRAFSESVLIERKPIDVTPSKSVEAQPAEVNEEPPVYSAKRSAKGKVDRYEDEGLTWDEDAEQEKLTIQPDAIIKIGNLF